MICGHGPAGTVNGLCAKSGRDIFTGARAGMQSLDHSQRKAATILPGRDRTKTGHFLVIGAGHRNAHHDANDEGNQHQDQDRLEANGYHSAAFLPHGYLRINRIP